MLMWSVIAISRPGPTSGRSDPAALVSTRISVPAARTARTGTRSASTSPPSYRCALPRSTTTDTPAIRPSTTNALRYNTDKGIWQEQDVKFNGSLLKAGENSMTLTVPAGDVQSGVVWDYLRLEMGD